MVGLGSYLNLQIDIRLFLVVMSVVLIAAGIGTLGGLLGIGGGVFVAPLLGGRPGSMLMSQKMKGGTIPIVFGIALLLFSAKLLHKAFG